MKSNKGKKIELKNLDLIKELEESNCFDDWTKLGVSKIKNTIFKNNIIDVENKLIVSSIRLIKTSKLGRKVTPMVWEYYKNRGNLDVNQIIKKYGRNNLIINYSINPKTKSNIKPQEIIEIIEIIHVENEDADLLTEENKSLNK